MRATLLICLATASAAWSGERAAFSTVAPMATARSQHTATLLPNGNVLVAGGEKDGGNALAVAEIYNPSTNTWTAAPSLAFARKRHTATLLNNGLVLVVGGISESGSIQTPEIYDPIANTWTNAALPFTARQDHTATLLPNGKLLIAGGGIQTSPAGTPVTTPLNTAEIYDPATSGWVAATKMAKARFNHTATLLPDGRTVVAGGTSAATTPTDGTTQPGGSAPTNGAEIYDFNADVWSSAKTLATARTFATAATVSFGNVLVMGGKDTSKALSSSELYTVSTNTWGPASALIAARLQHTATMLTSGKVLVVGGTNGSVQLDSAELFDPSSQLWTPAGNLTGRRRQHTATLLKDGRVLIAGGFDQLELSTVEIFDPAANTAPPLALASAPTASPNPAKTTQNVTFTAAATGGTGSLTFLWDFGDSSTGAGPAVTHAYATAGTYSVTVTVTDTTQASVVGAVSVTVTTLINGGNAVVGINPDTDGDGFSDASEQIFGSDARNTQSVPLGITNVETPLPLSVSSLNITLHFNRAGKDVIRIRGTIPLAESFTAVGSEVGVDVSGIAYRGVVGATGAAGPGFKLQLSGATAAGSTGFLIVLNQGTFVDTLSASGLKNGDFRNQSATVVVSILLNKKLYQAKQTLKYFAHRDRLGMSRR